MSSIDNAGNIHTGAGVPGAGRFAGRVNSAPGGVLQDHAETSSASEFLRQRAVAASLHLSARNAFLEANRDAAIATLREQFPWATKAVFTRAWDDPEDMLEFAQLQGDNFSLDLADDDTWAQFFVTAPSEQTDAVSSARSWVSEMGAEVSAYLEQADVDADGWYEYHLDLSAAPRPQEAAGRTIDQLSPSDRNALYFELSERDGRLPSMVDTGEIAYQLREGSIAEEDEDLANALEVKFGSFDAAAEAISGSDAWFEQREKIGDMVHAQLSHAIGDAAQSVLGGGA